MRTGFGSNIYSEPFRLTDYLDSAGCGYVTDMQSACLRASSVGLCIRLKQAGLEPIIQLTGRDRNRIAILGDLLAASAFGIDTILAVTGDHPVVGDCPGAKPVYDLDSVGILRMLQNVELTGNDCGGNPLSSIPKFYSGACVTPVYEPLALQIDKLRRKVDAGASYIQTQGIFSAEQFSRFLDEVDRANIKVHIMAGIIPLKSAGMANFMNKNVPGIQVPEADIHRLEEAARRGEKPMTLGIKMAAELIGKLRDQKLGCGVHIMTVGAERNIPAILDESGICL